MIRWACGAYKERYTKQSCSFWPRYAPNRLSTGDSPQAPLGELTVLPRPSSWFRWWGRPGNGKEGEEGEGKGKRRKRRDERGSWTPPDFQMD